MASWLGSFQMFLVASSPLFEGPSNHRYLFSSHFYTLLIATLSFQLLFFLSFCLPNFQ